MDLGAFPVFYFATCATAQAERSQTRISQELLCSSFAIFLSQSLICQQATLWCHPSFYVLSLAIYEVSIGSLDLANSAQPVSLVQEFEVPFKQQPLFG